MTVIPFPEPHDDGEDGDIGESGDVDGREFLMVDGVVADETEANDALTSGSANRASVLPKWLTGGVSFRAAIGSLVGRWVHGGAFHMVRLPLYALRLVLLAPTGVGRLVRVWWRWVSDVGFQADREAIRQAGRGDITKLREGHDRHVLRRAGLSLAALLTGVLLGLWLWSVSPATVVAGGLLAALLFGFAGRPVAERRVVERVAYRTPAAPLFTESLMLQALRECGGEPKDAREIQVVQPPAKTRTGWEAIVVLGVEAEKLIAASRRFATVVGRPKNCVWLSGDSEESAGWLRIVVTRKSLRRTKTPPWPLFNKTFNYFVDEVPVGINELGEPVTAAKAYRSTVYGGMMGSGKTVDMINTIAALAVDPRVEIHIFDLKGGTDWMPFAPIAHFYRSGSDGEDHDAILADLEELNRRMDARFRTLKDLPEGLRSAKTNDVLASRRGLDLHPIVVLVDETQECFEFAAERKRYHALISRLMKKGRAVTITAEVGTQEVKQPTLPVAGLCHWRNCKMVQGHGPVDLVLGTGAYSNGHRADELTPDDVGIGYFGAGKEISVVKSYYIDPESGELGELVERLRAERAAAGLLTGLAAGRDAPDTNVESTLKRVARLWPPDTKSLQWVELVGVLHAGMPGEYPPVTDLANGIPVDVSKAVESLSARLARHGIAGVNVRSSFLPLDGKTSSVRRGVRLDDITEALTNMTTEFNDRSPSEAVHLVTNDQDTVDQDTVDLDIDDLDTDSGNVDTDEVANGELDLDRSGGGGLGAREVLDPFGDDLNDGDESVDGGVA